MELKFRLPWRETKPQAERLVDQKISDARRFMAMYEPALKIILFHRDEIELFRSAFILSQLPKNQTFPFTTDPQEQWRSPEQQLERRKNSFYNGRNLDPEDDNAKILTGTLITYGARFAEIQDADGSIIEEHLNLFNARLDAAHQKIPSAIY